MRVYENQVASSAITESFNGSLRDELLNEEIFDSLDDARRKRALWRYDDNTDRPHSSLADLPLFSGPLGSRVCAPFVCHHSAA